MTTEQKVEEAAKDAAVKQSFCFTPSSLTAFEVTKIEHERGFTAGANYALTELLPGELGEFLEWADIRAVRNGAHSWTIGAGDATQHYTTAQLVQEYLKQKQ